MHACFPCAWLRGSGRLKEIETPWLPVTDPACWNHFQFGLCMYSGAWERGKRERNTKFKSGRDGVFRNGVGSGSGGEWEKEG